MVHPLKTILVFGLIAFMLGCKQKQDATSTTDSTEKEIVKDESTGIPESWIENRVEKAKARLASTEAGQVIWNAMEAHGGLKTWYANGALAMRFNYQPLDGSTQRDSYQVVDTWNNKAVHWSVKDSTQSYGWTGKKAWIKANDETVFPYDTKFWAITPLYLMGFPFVLDGEGVNLELLADSDYKGKTNKVVKITFDAGTGDAPDDYYILHFDAETNLLIGTRYIVSYPQYFKDGGHAPEKFMEVGTLVNTEGILLPSELKTHWTVEGKPGEHITQIDISDYSFKKELGEDFYEMPPDAKTL